MEEAWDDHDVHGRMQEFETWCSVRNKKIEVALDRALAYTERLVQEKEKLAKYRKVGGYIWLWSTRFSAILHLIATQPQNALKKPRDE